MDPQSLNLGGFDISASALIAGFIFGVIGFFLFREGKRRTNHPVMIIGMIQMVYPLFITGSKMTWAVGFATCVAAYYFWER